MSSYSFFGDAPPALTRSSERMKTTLPASILAKNTTQDSDIDWPPLILVAGVTVLGLFNIPHFALGLAVGVLILLATYVLVPLLSALGICSVVEEGQTKAYEDFVKRNPLYSILLAPALEELEMRGVLQPLLILGLVFFFPGLALAPFFATGLSAAVGISILCTSLIFGLLHLSSSEANDNWMHAAIAGLKGVVLGVLAVQFGLAVAFAAHMMNNALAWATSVCTPEEGLSSELEYSEGMSFAP